MCTVSFIPVGDTVYLTHNRDEKSSRPAAEPPQICRLGENNWLLPRDPAAGGSWIALGDQGQAAVLLNGAFEKHVPRNSYRKSRGLIFLDIISGTDMERAIRDIDLTDIEPFTLILFCNNRLQEFRWDGSVKHFLLLDAGTTHFWSSATLYDREVSSRKRQRFLQWLKENPLPGKEKIFDFHTSEGAIDPDVDLVINRNGQMLTVSISSITIAPHTLSMQYFDLRRSHHYSLDLTPGKLHPVSI